MKASSLSIFIAAILLFGSSRPAAADPENGWDYTPGAVAADALIARPLCLVVMIVGTGLFVVTLPIAAISRSVDKSAGALVREPAKQTFVRKLGDLAGLDD